MAKGGQMDMTGQQYFGYEIAPDVYQDLISTLQRIQQGGSTDELGRQAARQLVRLTELGLLAYYERPANLIAMPSVVRKAADTGISAIFKAVDMVIHRVLAKRSLEELQSMAADMSHMIGISDHAEPRYFICFPLPGELSERASLMLARVQQDQNVDEYRNEIISSLEDLIEEAIGVFYTQPLSRVQVGRITRAAADMGMTTVKKGSSMVLHKVFKTMPHTQLVPLADYFQTLLHQGVQPHANLAAARP